MYGHGWKPTLTTHDGSRDFQRRDRDGWLWAECKAYSERLSVYAISPTLIMALIEDPHTVIVVSRSHLNNNAARHLSAYQSISTKRIIALDGLVLDNAILGTGLHKKYFSFSTLPAIPQTRLQINTSVSPDALSDPAERDLVPYANLARAKRPIFSVRGGFVRIDFCIKNLSHVDGSKLKLSVNANSLSRSLRLVSFGGRKGASFTVLKIPPAGIVQTSLIVQPREASHSLALPTIKATGEGVPDQEIETGTLAVSHLYQIDIAGRKHRKILREASSFLRGRRRTVTVVLEGASGTGKSRLALEIAKAGVEEGQRCHIYDPEFEDAKAADHVVRDLIADLSELPRLPDIGKEKADNGTASSLFASVLARALYDQTFDIWKHVNEVVCGIMSLPQNTPTLLVVDNIQFTDDRFIDFIEGLILQLKHTHSKRFIIVLAVNTDFVAPESQMAELLRKLRSWSADPNAANAVYHSVLPEFDIDDVAEFIQAALSGTKSSPHAIRFYEKTLKLIIDRVQPRPLNLWQTLMYLVDEGLLTYEEDRLELKGDHTLLSRLSDIPAKLHDLLALRWHRIRQNCTREGIRPSELDATAQAAYLLGSDTQGQLLSAGATERAVGSLLKAGILVSNRAGRIQFFHAQVFNFFRDRFRTLDGETAKQLKQNFETNKIARAKFQQYFLLCHFAKAVTGAVLIATVRELDRNGLTVDYWRQYCDALLSYLIEPSRSLGKTSIQGVTLVGQWQQRFESLKVGATTLRSFLTGRILRSSRKSLPGDVLFAFYTTAINAFLAIYEDEEALELITVALRDLEQCRFLAPNRRDAALGTILNRQAATLKNFGYVEEALAAGRDALARFERIKDYSMVVETHFDIASILLGTRERGSEARQLLEDGCKIFRLHQTTMREPTPCRYFYIRAEMAIQDHDFLKAYEFCTAGTHHAERVGNHFWGIRLILLDVTARLLKGGRSRKNLDQVRRLLLNARDWSNVSHAERSRWAISYLEGKYWTLAREPTLAGKAFCDAMVSLGKRLRTPEQVAWRRHVLKDIAVTCRREGIDLDESTMSLLVNQGVRAELSEIVSMSDRDFKTFQQSRVREAAFSRGTQTIEST